MHRGHSSRLSYTRSYFPEEDNCRYLALLREMCKTNCKYNNRYTRFVCCLLFAEVCVLKISSLDYRHILTSGDFPSYESYNDICVKDFSANLLKLNLEFIDCIHNSK